MKKILLLTLLSLVISEYDNLLAQSTNFPKTVEPVKNFPSRENLWVFVLAGQSNMAGRGFVEPQDTITNSRIITIDKTGNWIEAKEPLHFYEPQMTGLDCGLSFANELLNHIPDSVSIVLIPCAVGGSSIQQWIGDSLHRDVRLLSNFKEKVDLVKQKGVIKGILWHQGESNAGEVELHSNRLELLFCKFRSYIEDCSLPIVMGKLGSYAKPVEKQAKWNQLNHVLDSFVEQHNNVFIIETSDFTSKGDDVHFDSKSQRMMGKRFARKYQNILNIK